MAFKPASSPPVVHQENISSLPPPAAATGVFAVVPPLPVEGTAVAAGASVPQAVRSIDNTARRLIITKVLRLRFMPSSFGKPNLLIEPGLHVVQTTWCAG